MWLYNVNNDNCLQCFSECYVSDLWNTDCISTKRKIIQAVNPLLKVPLGWEINYWLLMALLKFDEGLARKAAPHCLQQAKCLCLNITQGP